MPKTKEVMAAEAIKSSKQLLSEIKGKATKTPKRSKPKAPSKSVTARSRKAASTKKTATRQQVAFDASGNPSYVEAEIVHAPVSGDGINGQVRGDITQTDPQTMAQALVAIQQQQNTVLVSQANKKLDKAVAVDQGIGLQVQLQQEKNATIHESVATQAMKTQQQSAKTAIEGVKLSGLQIDLEGESALLQPRQEAWEIKGLEAAIDNDGARALLEPRQEHWSLKAELAQVGLQKLRNQIQQEMSELYAPQPQQITQHDDYQ
ncbi:MAG: hypothetical protein AAFV85_26805 [Cyanobacteria bacterium J06634_6]